MARESFACAVVCFGSAMRSGGASDRICRQTCEALRATTIGA
jgi:hypothetical protein